MVDKLYQLKWEYNNTLNRYYNGCNYITENPTQFDKYIGNVMDLKKKIDNLLDEIMKKQNVTTEEILGGFEIC